MKKICCIVLSVAAFGMTTGCVTKLPPAPIEYTFSNNDFPVFTELPLHPEKQDDLKKIVELGIALGDNGQHEKSAQVFLQGAKDFRSVGGRLEMAFVQAAVIEHFKAGRIDLVRDDFRKLDTLQHDNYTNYDDLASIRSIRRIVTPN